MANLLNAWLSDDNAAPAPAPKAAPVQRKRKAAAPMSRNPKTGAALTTPAIVRSDACPPAPAAAPKAAPAPAEIITFRAAHVRAVDNGARQRIASRSYDNPKAAPVASDSAAPVKAANGFSAVPMGQDNLFWAVDPEGLPVAMIRPAGAAGQWHKVDLSPAVWADFQAMPRDAFIAKHLSS